MSSFFEISLTCVCAGTVTITRTQQAPPPPVEVPPWASEYSWQPCVSLMVDKMVDVDVPLTMN